MYQVMFGLLSCCHQNTTPGVLHVWGVCLLGEQDSLRVQFHYRCCIGYSWIVFMSWHRARKSHQFDPDTLAQTVRAPITLHHWWLEPLHMLTAYRLHQAQEPQNITKLCNFIHCLPIASQFLYTCIYPSSASPSWLLQSKNLPKLSSVSSAATLDADSGSSAGSTWACTLKFYMALQMSRAS